MLWKSGVMHQFQRALDDICYGFAAYVTPLAVGRLKPCGERLGTFAGIARTAAKRDVFPRDYFRVVNDVFPARKAPFAWP
jgi:hypothetical protein